MKKYFLTIVVMALFAIGFAASDETESSSTSNSSSYSSEQAEEEKDFFENGYTYSANCTVQLEHQTLTQKINLKIWKDGTKEITVSWQDEYDHGESTYEVEIRKMSDSYKDVYATWYEILDCPVKSYSTPLFYVDEKGNIINLKKLGNEKNIYDAIATGDCIVGKFTKTPL